ncbi:hypothetical protein BDW02DRAFT_568718 [Decorospora gaudefroyi]|uniref:Uncharacterized protein n=1 Tax=Decorospora gaudefroyi TaxID=184978 RepID=A0A6A5KH28_9PLEO|nr:hypothetical protein BDW02DRAFT_568718 [Decorospora gaudefroyi]
MAPLSQPFVSTIVAEEELQDSFSSMDIYTSATLAEQSPYHSAFSQHREGLLSGPSTLLIASHSGTLFDYAYQRSAAEGVVSSDRNRQLIEQTESNHRRYTIEFPIRALCAVSNTFREGCETCPDISQVSFDMGNILPGYAMCVLDWLVKALRSKTSMAFVPGEPNIDGEDKWYWVYCYAAMRSLGMETCRKDRVSAFTADTRSIICAMQRNLRTTPALCNACEPTMERKPMWSSSLIAL